MLAPICEPRGVVSGTRDHQRAVDKGVCPLYNRGFPLSLWNVALEMHTGRVYSCLPRVDTVAVARSVWAGHRRGSGQWRVLVAGVALRKGPRVDLNPDK